MKIIPTYNFLTYRVPNVKVPDDKGTNIVPLLGSRFTGRFPHVDAYIT